MIDFVIESIKFAIKFVVYSLGFIGLAIILILIL